MAKAIPIWLRQDVVAAIHAAQIAEHGGKRGVRDKFALESALVRPAEYYAHSNAPLPDLAAAYISSIMRKQPFLDGNKRTAFVVALTFLRLNGLRYAGTHGEAAAIMLRLSKGRASENDVATFLRNNVKPGSPL